MHGRRWPIRIRMYRPRSLRLIPVLRWIESIIWSCWGWRWGLRRRIWWRSRFLYSLSLSNYVWHLNSHALPIILVLFNDLLNAISGCKHHQKSDKHHEYEYGNWVNNWDLHDIQTVNQLVAELHIGWARWPWGNYEHMLVCIKIVDFPCLTLSVSLSRCYCVPICNMTINCILLFYLYLYLFIKVILRNGSETPTTNIIFSECQSCSCCMNWINIQSINGFPITFPRDKGTVA